MAQTDLDRLQIAWKRLQDTVNKTLPTTSNRLWSARDRLRPTSGNTTPPF